MRQVLPELLDSLPHDDPAALRSRGELLMINRIMGNHRWLCRTLQQPDLEGRHVLELGAGDGALAQRAWREGASQPARWSAIDLAPMPAEWPGEASWLQSDLFSLQELPDAEIVVTNLFLHHFHNHQLEILGRRLPSSCRTFLACEPARRRVHSLQGRLLSVLAGLSQVTRHDMLASIRAGFTGNELAHALRLQGWQTETSTTTLGAYRFKAWR